MVKIKKNGLTLTVPAGALKRYVSAGWEPEKGSKKHKEEKPEDVQDVVDEVEDPEEEVEYVDPEELARRPLAELDRDELKILAEYKGLDTSEFTSAKQIRNALKSLE